MRSPASTRRSFLAVSTPVLLAGAGRLASGKAKPKDEDEVSPTEDLMREHGVLRRLLLVYGESIHRLEAVGELKLELVERSAHIIRAFIEDYHERDEEEFIFPRFEKAGKMVALVKVLRDQHQAGRRLTADVLRLAVPATASSPSQRQALAAALRSFIRMYEPHAAREDTELFPAFRQLISDKELLKLQDTFEQKEQALPMGNFEKMVADVSEIERGLGIGDLAAFTPPKTP